MNFSLQEVDPSWHTFFTPYISTINEILSCLDGEVTPPRNQIFRAFKLPLASIKVVVIGQDPYPGSGIADGLAFSSLEVAKIPASLRNIFKEYASDLGISQPTSADLTRWNDQGVMLLNRTLTTVVGERNAHLSRGWTEITYAAAKLLGEQGVIAILWGNNARELAPLFNIRIESVHPSPLSARKGFFGSKPFSRVNQVLIDQGKSPIDWKL